MTQDQFLQKPMMVMQTRTEFSIQYKASPKIKFKEEHLKNKKDFVEFLSKTSKHWKEGNYFLRSDLGPFAGFYVKKGGKVKLLKENQNKTPYLCWGILGTK